jgi:hypothetical protein
LAANRATSGLPCSDHIKVSGEKLVNPQAVLRAIEAALTKARSDAVAIEDPVLAYFIDMAITELGRAQDSAHAEGLPRTGRQDN